MIAQIVEPMTPLRDRTNKQAKKHRINKQNIAYHRTYNQERIKASQTCNMPDFATYPSSLSMMYQ